MNILLINYEYPPYGAGAGNATQEMSRAFVKSGHSATVLTGGAPKDHIGLDGVRIIQVGSVRSTFRQNSLKDMYGFVYEGMIWVKRQDVCNWDIAIVFFALPCGQNDAVVRKKTSLKPSRGAQYLQLR